jgi:ketosteroid isomerase-like protein
MVGSLMSKANVEAVKRMHEAFNRGDRSVLFALLDPEVEWDFSTRLVDPGLHLGHAGVEYFLREMDEVWEDFRSELEDLFEAGDHVVAFVRISGRGRASGLEIDVRVGQTFSFKDGRIVASRYYGDRTEALQAAGLSE